MASHISYGESEESLGTRRGSVNALCCKPTSKSSIKVAAFTRVPLSLSIAVPKLDHPKGKKSKETLYLGSNRWYSDKRQGVPQSAT